jgi:hypothetical protein
MNESQPKSDLQDSERSTAQRLAKLETLNAEVERFLDSECHSHQELLFAVIQLKLAFDKANS